MKKAIIHARIYTGEKILDRKVLLLSEGKITAIEDKLPEGEDWEIIDLGGKNIAPGLIDIQINGGYTRYFSRDPGEETLSDIDQACRDFGTLYYLPTLISSPTEVILNAIGQVRQYREKYPEKGLLGMHLEGPFFSPEKRGAHNKDIIRLPTDKEIKQIVRAGKDVIKVMTIAPELFRDDQLRYLQDSGILLSAGHSNMDYGQAQQYFAKGIHLVTHLYNAMSAFAHRAPGLAGATLENDQVYTSLILDGHHCHYGAARLAKKLKGDKLFLITDSSFLGRKMQDFQWDTFDASLQEGTYRNKEGNLAGAAISMPEAVQNAREHLGCTLQQAIEMATSRVARAIRMDDRIGFIKENYPARFFVFDDHLNQYHSLIF